jgi:hypothetical protein
VSELTLLALEHAGREGPTRSSSISPRGAKDATKRAATRSGVSPYAFYHLVRYRRKGGFLDTSRRRRGLGPLDRGGP